jgi:hypothetical protein
VTQLANDGETRVVHRIVVVAFAAQHRLARACGYDRRIHQGVPA